MIHKLRYIIFSQDGTFSLSDLLAAFNEYEVQRVLHAYENCITIDIHCAGEGHWSTHAIANEPFRYEI